MRIEAYNQVTQIYNSSKAAKAKSLDNVKKRDEVQISRAGRDYQVAKQAVSKAPDVREDRVIQVRGRMAAGTYKVDNGEFAAKLLEKYEAYC